MTRLGLALPPAVGQLGARLLGAVQLPGAASRFARDLYAYRRMPSAEGLRWRDTFPQFRDRVATSPFDRHYFYQDIWAARHVAERRPDRHVDVGSRVDYAGFLTAICEVAFVDIRPLTVSVDRFESVAASVLELPMPDRSIGSLSCLHVAEHIGLGRYGDALEPRGTRRAAAELQRVLAPGGHLLFSLPVGRPRVCFNAHRIHDPRTVRDMFDELELVEFSGIDDDGCFRRDLAIGELAAARYACGLFRFERRQPTCSRSA
jgi:SAM-dependent methyltransferase